MTERAFCVLLAVSVCCIAQIPKEFEVVSVKPQAPGDTRGSIGPSPGAFIANGIPLKILIEIAYRVKDFQISGGPEWIETDHWDVSAKAPAGFIPTGQQMQPMMQALLADRFRLKLHRETRELSAFALVVGKGGPKLTASTFADSRISIGHGIFTGQKIDMAGLADALARESDRTIVDQTGLSGEYDVTLKWSPDAADPDPAAVPLFTAIQEQLGLKLEATKAPVEILVIDSVQKSNGELTMKKGLFIAGLLAAVMAAQGVKSFDIVSIKPNPDGHGLDAGTQPGGRYTARNVPVMFLLTEAFGVKAYQISGATKGLDEDGNTGYRREGRRFESAEQRATQAAAAADAGGSLPTEVSQGDERISRLLAGSGQERVEVFRRQQYSCLGIAQRFFESRQGKYDRAQGTDVRSGQTAGRYGRPHCDRNNTGLKGNYDFKLDWSTSRTRRTTYCRLCSSHVQEQLGLKLVSVKKAPVEVIVVDRASAKQLRTDVTKSGIGSLPLRGELCEF